MNQHIVNVSGGKDSTATYLLALERGMPFRAVTAETDNENPITDAYIDDLARRTNGPQVERIRADFTKQLATRRKNLPALWSKQGIPDNIIQEALAVLYPTGNVYVDLCMWKGRFPSQWAQFCTTELKINPVHNQVILPALEKGNVIQWLGVRRDESPARADTPDFIKVRWTEPKATKILYFPIAAWKWQDVFAMHDKHGLKPNPLYSTGVSRVGCWPCINARKNELNIIRIKDPEAVERLLEWEAIVKKASKRGGATFFAADVTPEGKRMVEESNRMLFEGNKMIKKGNKLIRKGSVFEGERMIQEGKRMVESRQINGFPDAKRVLDWARTKRGGKQYDALETFDPPCKSEYGMCE